MNNPKHISEVILSILTNTEAMKTYPKGTHDVTDLTPKNGKQKKARLKKGLDYDIDENGNIWMNPNVKNIGLSIGEL